MAGQRYVKRRTTKRATAKKPSREERLRGVATSRHNEKMAKAIHRHAEPKQAERTARYARTAKVSRRRKRAPKKGGFLDELLRYRLDLDARSWFKADPAKRRASKGR